MELKNVWWVDVDWINLAHDGDKRRPILDTVTNCDNLRLHKIRGNSWLYNELFLLLHRACCRVTQLLYQTLHINKIYKIYTLKRSDMFRS